MAKRKVGLFYLMMLMISIVFLVIIFNIDTDTVVDDALEKDSTDDIILDANESIEDPAPIDSAVNETLENQTDDGLAYAAGCWCPGSVADYWDKDCNCHTQQIATIEEKNI